MLDEWSNKQKLNMDFRFGFVIIICALVAGINNSIGIQNDKILIIFECNFLKTGERY